MKHAGNTYRKNLIRQLELTPLELTTQLDALFKVEIVQNIWNIFTLPLKPNHKALLLQ